METKYIIWHWDKDTNYYYAENKEDDELGVLCYERTGTFMHWCWYQYDEIRMSPGCLQEVRDKQKELHNKKRKEIQDKKPYEYK